MTYVGKSDAFVKLGRHDEAERLLNTALDAADKESALGYAPDYNWIDLSLPTHNGLPIHDRGIVESCRGLYFIGLLFLYSLSSALVGGVGRDAEHIVDHIVSARLSKKDDAVVRATTAGRQYA